MANTYVPNILNALDGFFKEIYTTKGVADLIPDGVKLLSMIPFAKKEATIGRAYHQPVILGHEHGVTFAGPNDDAYDLNAAIPGQVKDAVVQGTQLVLRSVMGFTSASRAAEGGSKAFQNATKFLVANMLRSITKKLEIEMLYGQVGYATLAAALSSTVIAIPDAQWAPGIWAGSENMPIDIRDSSGGNSRLRTVVSVDFAAHTITVDSAVVLANDDVIYHKGAYGNEFAGLHKIITNTGSLFGISAASYSLFKGNSYDAGASALSFGKIQSAISKAVEKGLDNDAVVLVNPASWSDLLTDQAALRMYDSSYKSSDLENGAKQLKFHGQNGSIEIVSSIYVKQGFAYVISLDEMVRMGSTDVTFKRPGKGDEFFRELENSAGYQLTCMTDQALFCHAPGKNVLIYNIAV